MRRAHRAAEHAPGVGVEPARNVEREHRAGLPVDVVDQLCKGAFDRPCQADAEEAVYDEVPGLIGNVFFASCERDTKELLLQDARDDFRVAAVTPRPGQDKNLFSLVSRKSRGQFGGCRAGALHERRVARGLLDGADVLGFVDGLGHARIISAAARICRLFPARAGRRGGRGCARGTPTASAGSHSGRRARPRLRAESSSARRRR